MDTDNGFLIKLIKERIAKGVAINLIFNTEGLLNSILTAKGGDFGR
jgi:hypothetical protein